MVPAAVSFQLCLGGVYAWSVFNAPLSRVVGVVAPSAADWQLQAVVPVFSTAILFLGLTAAFSGKHLDVAGPRAFAAASSALWGGGFVVAAAGVATHTLPVVYLGYGVMGGIGLGLGYLPPVGTLLKWFPDRRGMAAGLAIGGFGGGAMVAAPLTERLLRHFQQPPVFLGRLQDVQVSTAADGSRFVTVDGQPVEVVVAISRDLASWPGLEEGVYQLGTGSVGLAETFAVIGSMYFAVMTAAAAAYRVPAPGWAPAGWTAPAGASSEVGVHHDTALKRPQFYLLWSNLALNTTAGIGMIAVSKDLMQDMFGTALPDVVTPSFASAFILLISVANMGGRFAWAAVSDSLGRRNTFFLFFGLGAPAYLSVPQLAQWVSQEPSTTPLYLFLAVSTFTFSTYGGGFACMPPYVGDVFGPRCVPGIFGRLLTAWSAAGVLGPVAVTTLRANAMENAIRELAAKVDPAAFEAAFSAPKSQLTSLIETKTVTIPALLQIAPDGTPDPSCLVYNDVMSCLAALQVVALLSNYMIAPAADRDSPAEPAGLPPRA
eukprot:TRINITY_DN18618_c0_g1_i1.p1 TRINITY_DN18618_c0_g1~~TRINITY_DN18618_c0_g1_i1.p1  ORF type:complete len:608 (+),score=179.09 TRINITY_DN18618_c0_g1_i1:192-1826(+)